MHSFHHSRARIAFAAFCALAMSASLAGAWVQTGAAALLAAAAVAALYGVVHAFDLRRGGPPSADIRMPEGARDIAAEVPAIEPPAATQDEAPEVDVAAPVASQSAEAPRARAPRKPAARRGRASKSPKQAKAAPVAEAEPGANEAAVVELVAFDEPEPVMPEEMTPAPVTPLFEAEPFARQQRVFGRKAG